MSSSRVIGGPSWRGFAHEDLSSALSSDLAESGWVENPTDISDGSSAFVQSAGNALRNSIFKKWKTEDSLAEDRALLIFLEANHLSGKWTLPSDFSFSGLRAETWGRIKWELDKFFHPNGMPLISSYSEIWDAGYTGPGASIGAAGQSFYAKFGCSRLTSTSEDLYMSYKRYVSQFATWEEAECLRARRHGACNVVESSLTSFAPKNAKVARLICTEPSLNMFAQLGVKKILEKRLHDFWGVDMEDQPEINRFLAKLGSEGLGFGTLDLASASDSVSVELCRLLLPLWVFNLLVDLRSPVTTLRTHGLCVELNMIGTMGNGFTFPIMTILLSSIIRAVYHTLGIPIQDNRRVVVESGAYASQPWLEDRHKMVNVHANWAVFGDDIISRSEAYSEVVEVLQLCGFTVNLSKSFNQGPFRESCGHDYLSGLNIRGVYLQKVSSLQDLAVAVNLFSEWTARTGIRLSCASRYLMSLFRDNKVPYVPYASPLDSGIRVPYELIPSFVRRTRKGSGWQDRTCYKAWTAQPAKVKFGDGVVMTPSGYRRLGYNANALLLSFLLGEVRDGEISIRQQHASLYRTQWHTTQNWDYVPPSYWFNHQRDWRRFSGAVYSNLFE